MKSLLFFVFLVHVLYVTANDVTCKKKGKFSKTVTIGSGDSYSFKTQAKKKYGKNVKCSVTYKRDSSCPKLKFSCSKFNIDNTNAKKCSGKTGDRMMIQEQGSKKAKSYCKKNSPDVSTTSNFLKVSFISNKKKHSTGAQCMVECESDTTTPTSTGGSGEEPVNMMTSGEGPTTTTTTTTTTPPDYGNQCGVVNKERIIGGQETSPYEYPWQALLFNGTTGLPFCGGSIISSRIILTAAHCTWGKVANEIGVAVGVHDYAYGNISAIMRAESKKEHPAYAPPPQFNYDVAFLFLPGSLTFSKRVQRVCLPPTSLSFAGYSATVSGWGLTNGSDNTSGPLKLHEVELTVVSNSQCDQAWGGGIKPEMLCATGPGKGGCFGDSGGPLTTTIDGLEYQIGVVSFVLKGCNTTAPSVFARVTEVINQERLNKMIRNKDMAIQQLFNP